MAARGRRLVVGEAGCGALMLALVCGCGSGRGGDGSSGGLTTTGAGSGTNGPSAVTTSAPSSASASAPSSASAGATESGYHCFSWIHGPQFSRDCYPSRAECERARLSMQGGARPTTPACERAERVSCVRLSMPPDPTEQERCFADAAACGRYRAFVQKTGHRVTACEDR